jgi:hypothetical protein
MRLDQMDVPAQLILTSMVSCCITMRRVVLGRAAWLAPLTAAIASVAGLMIAEVALRLLEPNANQPQREFDPYLGWRGRPDLRVVLRERAFSIGIEQNSHGFRDLERSIERPAHVDRILCVGDSFTWGWGVEQEDIYTRRLERLLSAAGRPTEVLNAGVGGYGTDQELLYLRRAGLRFRPDIVICQASGTDLEDITLGASQGMYFKPYFLKSQAGSLRLAQFPVPPMRGLNRLAYWVSRRSRLAYFIRHRIDTTTLGHRVGESEPAPAPPKSEPNSVRAPKYGFELFCRLIRAMDATCRRHGARLLVLIGFTLQPEELARWRAQCGQIETVFAEAWLLQMQRREGRRAYLPHDGHWTRAGHRWIAECLASYLLERDQRCMATSPPRPMI